MSDLPLPEEEWVFYIHPTGHVLGHRERIDGRIREFPVYSHAAIGIWNFSDHHISTKDADIRYDTEKLSNDFWEGIHLIYDFLQSEEPVQQKEMLQSLKELQNVLPYHEAEALDRLFGTIRNLDEDPGNIREIQYLFSEVVQSE